MPGRLQHHGIAATRLLMARRCSKRSCQLSILLRLSLVLIERGGGVVTISLRFRRPQFKGPIWTLSEVISSSLAPVSHSFIRCRTVRRGSAGRPGSARPSSSVSARPGLARPGSAADGVFAAVRPGLARPGSAAEVIFGSHRGAASAAPEYYSQSRI